MSVAASLAVMRNAFSTATASAKIPDGAVSHSITERSASAFQLLSPAGRLTIALTPSILSHLQYSAASNVTDLVNLPNTNHAADSTEGNVGDIDQWRLVSCGLRLTCINGSESLNGWFEAIRVASSYSDTMIENGIIPNSEAYEANILNSVNWANHPSYVTGRLRDIGKHTFYLQPTDKYEFSKTGFQMDTNFDTVLIRIHSAVAAPETQQTGIHYHVVRNFELCYDAQSNLARFQTGCPVYLKGVDNVRKAMTKDPKASMIRAASAYAYR